MVAVRCCCFRRPIVCGSACSLPTRTACPANSSLTNPALGDYVRRSDQPDLFQGELQNYNVTVNYDLDFAELVSSTTISTYDASFYVDLAGTFGQAFPFALDAYGFDDILVQEARLVSSPGGSFDWVVGMFYYDKRRSVDFFYRSSEEFLDARRLTGLPDPPYYQKFNAYTDQSELAGFGELTWHFNDDFWVTGGLRYTNIAVQSFTRAGGYNSNYLLAAFFGLQNFPLTVTPIQPATGLRIEDNHLSWKASASWRPSPDLTTYVTVATGFRPPVVNAFAGRVSTIDPGDIVIPPGAVSDQLTNYEVGLKGTWLDNRLSTNIAIYYIDWQDIQVQANRVSDSVQFATNIGGAESYGIEFEILARPFDGLNVALNGSFNDAKVNESDTTGGGDFRCGARHASRIAAFPGLGDGPLRFRAELVGERLAVGRTSLMPTPSRTSSRTCPAGRTRSARPTTSPTHGPT